MIQTETTTLDSLKELLTKVNNKIDSQNTKLNEKIDNNQNTILSLLSKVEKDSKEALAKTNKNEKSIKNLEQEISDIKRMYNEKYQQLKNELSEQTDGNQNLDEEKTWGDTDRVFANYLQSNLGWNGEAKASPLNDIERIHRGPRSDRNNGYPAPIYIKFYSWKTLQNIIETIIKGNKAKKLRISVQQMYSKQTQKIMKEANSKKLEIQNDPRQSETRFYVKYPGVLMMKEKGKSSYTEVN